MSLLSILGSPVTALVKAVGSIIDDVTTSDEEKAAAKIKLAELTTNFTLSMAAAQRDVLVAEAKSESWLARSWRPITMLVFVAIIANNYVFVPYLTSFGLAVPTLTIPPGMWSLLNVGIGGYIVSRGAEKIFSKRGQQ